MAKTVGELRKSLHAIGKSRKLENGVTVELAVNDDIDFRIDGGAHVSELVAWIPGASDDDNDPAFSLSWMNRKNVQPDSGQRSVIEKFVGIEQIEIPQDASGHEHALREIEGLKRDLSVRELERDEADQRAEDAERAHEREKGRSQGVLEVVALMLEGRDIKRPELD